MGQCSYRALTVKLENRTLPFTRLRAIYYAGQAPYVYSFSIGLFSDRGWGLDFVCWAS